MIDPDQPVLDEKFELLGKLGEGGMGSIYKVRHRLLNQILVVKTMTPKSAASPELQKRFLREAQTATRLRHPGIVSIYDFVLREDGSAYMVMEYLEGANLADALRRCGRVPAALSLFVADQVLSALDFMHEKGAIHRDISPDNVMLTREETGIVRAKLIDLGIAKVLRASEELTMGNEFIGKLRYASPEQLMPRGAAGAIDGRTDIYSFGAVAYELLTGVKAFRGDNILALFHSHQTGEIVPFDESDPDGELSPELREILLRAMALHPDDRFATAEEFRMELRSLLPGSPLEDAASRAYIQKVLALSPEDILSLEGRPRSEIGLSPGGTRPRSSPGSSRATSASLRGDAPTSAPATEEERTVRAVPPGRPPVATSARTAPAFRGEPLREARSPSGSVALPEAPQVGEAAVPRPAEAPRRRRLRTLALAAAVVGVAGVALALWLGRGRRDQPRVEEPPVRAPSPAAVAPAPTAPPAAVPTSPPPVPTALQPSEPVARATPAAVARPSPRPTLVAQVREIPASPQPAVRAAEPPLAGIRFCPLIDATSYQQGVVKERPKGFAADSSEFFRRARDDAGRIQIRLAVSPKEPAQGEAFQIVGDVVNGGDLGLVIERVEESSAAAAEGFQAVSGLNLPLEIPSGGAARIYAFRGVVSGRSPFSKELRITDSRNDTWRTSIRFRACPEP
jgi:serine/threonine-protein kinase